MFSPSQIASDFICSRWGKAPQAALILGTGSGQLADQIKPEFSIPYNEVPNFPRSTALGHKGQLVCGQLANRNVIALQGRFHLYEGNSFQTATLPVHVLNHLGIKLLVVTNASGGINPTFRSGEIMAIESHIDLMFRSAEPIDDSDLKRFGDRLPMRVDCYSSALIDQAVTCGRRNGFPVHRGVYAAMLGPNFETRAEYRFLRRIGADVAGMSTVPEVRVAAQYGMQVLGLSIIANVASPDELKSTSGEEVIDLAQSAGVPLQTIVEDAIQRS